MLVFTPNKEGSITVVPSKATEYSARWLASVTVTIVRPSGDDMVSVSARRAGHRANMTATEAVIWKNSLFLFMWELSVFKMKDEKLLLSSFNMDSFVLASLLFLATDGGLLNRQASLVVFNIGIESCHLFRRGGNFRACISGKDNFVEVVGES